MVQGISIYDFLDHAMLFIVTLSYHLGQKGYFDYTQMPKLQKQLLLYTLSKIRFMVQYQLVCGSLQLAMFFTQTLQIHTLQSH